MMINSYAITIITSYSYITSHRLHRYGKSIDPWQNHNGAISIYQTMIAEMHDGLVWFYQMIALENYNRLL